MSWEFLQSAAFARSRALKGRCKLFFVVTDENVAAALKCGSSRVFSWLRRFLSGDSWIPGWDKALARAASAEIAHFIATVEPFRAMARALDRLGSAPEIPPEDENAAVAGSSRASALQDFASLYSQAVADEFCGVGAFFTPVTPRRAPPPDAEDCGELQFDGTRGGGVQMQELMKANGRWRVSGAPGSGKSMLLRFLCLFAASVEFNSVNPALSPRLPIYLELENYERGNIRDLSLARNSFLRFGLEIDASDFEELITGYDILWIMDGNFGHKRDTSPAALWEELEDFVSVRPSDSFIVSSRIFQSPVSYIFETIYLLPFGIHVARDFTLKCMTYFDIDTNVDSLLHACNNALCEVSTSPLLLSFVVSLFITSGQVPAVSNVCRAYVSNLLAEDTNCKFDLEVKDMSLALLAFEMISSSRTCMEFFDAQACIQRRLISLVALSNYAVASEDLLQEFLHSGILMRQEGKVSFFQKSLLNYFADCELFRAYNFQAKLEMDQHFLRNLTKIEMIVAAAAMLHSDVVIEVGAGIGSVAMHFAPCRSICLVDLDPDLVKILRYRFQGQNSIEIVNDDALLVIKQRPFDVLVSNLPFFLTSKVIDILAQLGQSRRQFKRAVMSVHFDDDFSKWDQWLDIRTLCTLDEDDFHPRQPFLSKVIVVQPRSN